MLPCAAWRVTRGAGTGIVGGYRGRVSRRCRIALIAAVGLQPAWAMATDGTWINVAGGSWGDVANWAGGVIADGSGATGDFSTLDLTADAAVTLDTARTVGNLIFGDTDVTTVGGWTLGDGGTGSVLTLAGAGTPVITVNALGGTATATIGTVIAGNQGFAKAGAGTLVLTGSNTYTGATVLNAGTLSISSDANVGGASSTLTFNGGTLQITGGGMNNLDTHTVNWATFNGGIDNSTGTTLTISQNITGAGSFTKAGTGTVALTGAANNYTGGTTIAAGTLQVGDGVNNGSLPATGTITDNGSLSINTGSATTFAQTVTGTGDFTKRGLDTLTLTGNVSVGTFNVVRAASAPANVVQVNGGSLTASGLATVGGGSGSTEPQFILTSGSATFNGGIRSDSNDSSLIRVDGGTFSASDVNIRRNGGTAGSPGVFTTGLVITGGNSTIGTVELGSSNSNGAMSVEGGTTTVTGAMTLGWQTSGSRGGHLRVINAGTIFNATDTVNGIILDRQNGTSTANQTSNADFLNGTANVGKFTFGFDANIVSGSGTVNLGVLGTTPTAGTLYVGSGGMVKNGVGTYVANVNLTNGVLGAGADWSSGAGVNFNLPANNTVTIKAADAADVAHNITINGIVGGAGGFTKTGGGTLDLQGSNSWTGGATVNAGTLSGRASSLVGNIVDNANVALNDLSGSSSFTGVISGTGSLTKTGDGTSVIANAAAQTYTGATTVAAGTLAIKGNLASSSGLGVNNGGTLLVPAGGTTVNAATFGSGASDAMTLRINDGSGLAKLTVAGGLSTAGTTTIDIGSTNLSVGQFVAVDYSGSIGGAGFGGFTLGALPPRMIASLVDNTSNTSVDVNITGIDFPRWNGNVSGDWDINTTQNWRTITTNTPTTYLESSVPGDQVVFNDAATGTTNVNLTTTLSPSLVTVNNGTLAYTFSGAGKLSGPTPLIKQGTGTLTISNTGGNDYTGGTTLQGGTMVLAVSNALPADGALTVSGGTLQAAAGNSLPASGNVTVSGGTVDLGGNTQNIGGAFSLQGGVVANGTLNKTGANYDVRSGSISAQLTGGVGLTKSGSGTVVLTNNQTYTGATTVQAGTLQIGDGVTQGNIQSNTGTIANSGTVVFNQPGSYIWAGGITGTTGTVIKDGPGLLQVTGYNSGNTEIKAGTVELFDNPAGSSGVAPRMGQGGTLTVDAGATLQADGNTPLGLNTANQPPAVVVNGTIYGQTGSGSTPALTLYNTTINNGGVITSETDDPGTEAVLTLRAGVTVPDNANATISFQNLNTANTPTATVGANSTLTISSVLTGGNLGKAGPGTLRLTGANTTTGFVRVSAGDLVLGPDAWSSVTSSGSGVVNGGRMIFDYTGTTSPAATIAPLLKASHDSSNFTDTTQHLQTTNANDAAHGIAYRDDGVSSVTLIYTWYGDINMDGTVNGDDFALMDRSVAMHFASSASLPVWVNGDFNYDGNVDAADYLLMDTSYGKINGVLSPGFLAMRGAEFGSDYVAALTAAVPEPVGGGLLVAGGSLLVGLRRRRRRVS